MDSLSENSKEEEEALNLDNEQGEKDGDSLHEAYILDKSSLPDILQNQRNTSKWNSECSTIIKIHCKYLF